MHSNDPFFNFEQYSILHPVQNSSSRVYGTSQSSLFLRNSNMLNVLPGMDISSQISAAIAQGNGRIIEIPAGDFFIGTSIQGLNAKGITIRGQGRGATVLRALGSLNGSDHIYYNSMFNFNNLTTPYGQYATHIAVEDMTLNLTAQSASGVPTNASLGYNLCAVEFQNVNYARTSRVEVVEAYGNGIVMGSIDPLLSAALINPIIEDCSFDNVCRGLLPQYGITGSVMQFGAVIGGRCDNVEVTRAGAPWMDAFNCKGTLFNNVRVRGINNSPYAYGQKKGAFHSDFGLESCTLSNIYSENAGGIILNGNMSPVFFNGLQGTPGPQNCHVVGNTIKGHGLSPYPAPSVPVSNVEVMSPAWDVLIRIDGLATAWVNGEQQRLTGPYMKDFMAPASSLVKLVYSDRPTWVWYLAPAGTTPHYRILGGSTETALGRAQGNTFSANYSINAPGTAFASFDGYANTYQQSTVINAGDANGRGVAFGAYRALPIVNGGSIGNVYDSSQISDTHGASMLMANYDDDGVHNSGNRLTNSRLCNTVFGTSTPTQAWLHTSGNYT